jgi:chaperonin GroES
MPKTNLKPTLDRIVILRDKQESTTKGGIILPEKAQKEVNYGVVLAVGPGAFNMDGSRRPMGVKVGERVFFTDYHVTEASGGVVVVDEEDVLAIA